MFSYFKKKIYRKIAALFLVATITLIFFSYYVINWSFETKDSILDVHDAYLHIKLVQSWEDLSDTSLLKEELNSLSIYGHIYSLDSDTLCENSNLYWTNNRHDIDLCNYGSYTDTEYFTSQYPKIKFFDYYVSFGEYEGERNFFPATFIAHKKYKYLLITNEPLKNEFIKFIPSFFLAAAFMFLLYLLIRQFLLPISLMTARIASLEKGDLDSQITIRGEDELAQLSNNFNKLIFEVKNLLNQKESLLSDVSHELRTPLSKIRLLLAMAPKDQKIKQIDKQIQHLDAIITNILLSDKMSGAYANLEITQFSVSTLLQESLELSISRDVVNISDKNYTLYGDLIKLAVVIKNLLDNIEKYAKTDAPCEFLVEETEKFTNITVRDFGPGIDAALLENIKKPFVQGKQDKNKGFGLGLSICNKVILAHGGEFVIENNKNRGASFIIRIPRQLKNGKKQYQ